MLILSKHQYPSNTSLCDERFMVKPVPFIYTIFYIKLHETVNLISTEAVMQSKDEISMGFRV